MHMLPWTNVVQIQLKAATHSFISPWKTGAPHGSRCSAIIVSKSKRMILTNSHCVGDAVQVDVLREDMQTPVQARVVEIAHDVDLAWITTDSDSFWASDKIQETVSMSEGLPYMSNSVRVVGYPTGGSSISITQGIVSRIDAQTYPNGLMRGARNTPNPLLIVQVDAAINPGNSGGPVFDASGHLIGLAFAGMPGAQLVGYVIPNVYLRNFVASVSSAEYGHRWKAQSEIGALFRGVENPGMRKFLQLKDGQTGVQVRTVAPHSPLEENGIEKGDVLLKIDDMPILGSGKIERDFRGKMVTLPFSSLITEKPHGEATKMEFIHIDGMTGKRTLNTFSAVFHPIAPLVPRFYDAPVPLAGREQFGAQPSYIVLWSLVWGVFSNPMLQQLKGKVPWSVKKAALHRWRDSPDEEVVVLLQGLGNACTMHYDTSTMRILEYFNGKKVRNMRDLARFAMEAEMKQEAFMRITFAPMADLDIAGTENDPDVVLHRQFCQMADQQVLGTNNIASQFSEDVYKHVNEYLEEKGHPTMASNQTTLPAGSLLQTEESVLMSDSSQHGKYLRSTPVLDLPMGEVSQLSALDCVGSVESIPTLEATEDSTEDSAEDSAEESADDKDEDMSESSDYTSLGHRFSAADLERGAASKFTWKSVMHEVNAMEKVDASALPAQGSNLDDLDDGEQNPLLLAQLDQQHWRVRSRLDVHHLQQQLSPDQDSVSLLDDVQ